jgi:G3E family GTPase
VQFSLLELNRGSSNPVQFSKDHTGKIASFLESSNPGIIFLEASGLAKIREILSTLNTPPLDSVLYLAATIIIIDASRFEHEVTFLKNIRQQVKAADIVLVNKYEKLNRLESPEVIVKSYNYNKIIEWIKEINPSCKIYPSLYSRMPLEVVNSFLKSV